MQDRNLKRTIKFLGIAVLMPILLILSFSFASGGFNGGLTIFSTLTLSIGSSFSIGALIGFLFGIPRTQQHQNNGAADSGAQKDSDQSEATKSRYQVNTNLEQVSDWLTKILVGVGLTQFDYLKNLIINISTSISENIPLAAINKPTTLVATSIVYFLICGFLAGYIITRLFLTGAFSQAEEESKVGDISDELLLLSPEGSEFALPSDPNALMHKALMSLVTKSYLQPKGQATLMFEFTQRAKDYRIEKLRGK